MTPEALIEQWREKAALSGFQTRFDDRDLLYRCADELASALDGERATWQDISTAPKDGTSVIACRLTSPPHVEAMYWVPYDNGGGAWHWSFDGDSPNQQPTHWMPLPQPPAQEK